MSSRVSLLRCLLLVRPRDILPVGLPAALPPGKACLVHDSAGEAAMLLSGPRMPSVGFKPSPLAVGVLLDSPHPWCECCS